MGMPLGTGGRHLPILPNQKHLPMCHVPVVLFHAFSLCHVPGMEWEFRQCVSTYSSGDFSLTLGGLGARVGRWDGWTVETALPKPNLPPSPSLPEGQDYSPLPKPHPFSTFTLFSCFPTLLCCCCLLPNSVLPTCSFVPPTHFPFLPGVNTCCLCPRAHYLRISHTHHTHHARPSHLSLPFTPFSILPLSIQSIIHTYHHSPLWLVHFKKAKTKQGCLPALYTHTFCGIPVCIIVGSVIPTWPPLSGLCLVGWMDGGGGGQTKFWEVLPPL